MSDQVALICYAVAYGSYLEKIQHFLDERHEYIAPMAKAYATFVEMHQRVACPVPVPPIEHFCASQFISKSNHTATLDAVTACITWASSDAVMPPSDLSHFLTLGKAFLQATKDYNEFLNTYDNALQTQYQFLLRDYEKLPKYLQSNVIVPRNLFSDEQDTTLVVASLRDNVNKWIEALN